MSEIKRVKIGSIIESQIPEFLSVESPLFVEFLKQYYQSLEHQSGSIDIISNISKYKNSKKFNNIDLIESTSLTSDVLAFDTTINVLSTKGWPDTYGLLKINDEIITYLSKTETTFENCIRGFSGIDSLESLDNPEFLQFSTSSSSEHTSETVVHNLSNLFLTKFFEKFKFEFLPGFESRDFYENVSIENIAYKIKDLYSSKGTDQSYKLLFKILYGTDIEIIKPQQYTLSPSSNSYFITKNVLVEKISGGNPIDIKGNFLFQNITGIGTVSASIFNVEYRPVANKQFYEISLDSTSFTGNFEVSGKTRILEDVQVGSDTILVDSTVGFANSGTILVKPENSDFIEINYTGKNVNQFTGVTNVTRPLSFGLDLIEEKFAFSYVGVGNTSQVEFRVVNLIDKIDFSKTSNLRVGDSISLSGFGRDLYDQYEFNSWIYNIPTNHNIQNISQVDATKYRINLFDKVYFYQGEKILLIDNLGNTTEVDILVVEYSTSDLIKKYSNRILVQSTNTGSFNILNASSVRKKIYKSNHYSNYFSGLEKIPSGVQNTYVDADENHFYVTSSGLPNYTIFSTDNKKTVTTTVGTSVTDTFNVNNHNLLSGELIYYQPSTSSGITTGSYYVTKIDNNRIKLSYSKSDIFSKKYIQTTSSIVNDFLYKFGYENKTLKHQKLLKKFQFNRLRSSFDDLNERTTFNREIGLLINGVELLSPNLFDENIYYGNITSVDVINSGEDYDIIDVPPLEIKDETGTGVKGHLNISGTVREIKILNAGYGYQEKPKITITGGNGVGCVLDSNFVKTKVSAGFKADINVSTANNTIQFLNTIPFEDGEEIIYDSNKNSNIPGIINNSTYFVGIQTDNKIKLFNTKTDALQKINEIDIVGVSSGFHFISTLKNKNTFTKIYVKDPGKGYSNRKVKIPSVLSGDNRTSGISTFDSYIFAKNHGFEDFEIVTYSYTGSPISGLSTSTQYYVKIIDSNKFRLYEAGIGTSLSNENYIKDKFVKFNSLGIGTHSIGYPPIEIHVEAKSAIGSTTLIKTELKPIVLGSIEDVYLEDGGIGYGCTNIINYHRRPVVGIASITSEAILKPIIIDGSIVDVQIISRGNGFRENSEIIVYGDGKFAQIEPIVENGKLSNVNIVFGGVGYKSSNTTLSLKNRGQGAKFLANLKEWKINQVIKSKNIISDEDGGILYPSKNPNLGLQFINFNIPKKLRFQLSDNFTDSNKENFGTLNHSPILGYAYDGNPIYGPYSYNTSTGGFIRRMNSSYVLNVDLTPGVRPPSFESGFFIDDYEYDGSGDLDKHNGRFCITPEYPNGTYAYFTTIDVNSSNESTPRYPYVVGPYFYDKPITENFLPLYNQDINVFTTNLTRNVGPYYLNRANSYYDLIDEVSEEYKQEFSVTSINSGKIENVAIFSPGDNYQVNDLVDIDVSDTEGIQANIVVSEIDGREIESFSLPEDIISNAEFFIRVPNTVVKTTSPHGIKNGQPILISGVSTITASKFEGIKYVEVAEKESQLQNDINITAVTGLSTFITLKDISGFKVNDFIGIGTEVLLITNIDFKRSGFYVNRLENTGIHSAGNSVVLLPREFKIPTGDVKDLTFENYTTFFDPKLAVGVGTTGSVRTVVGFGTTNFENRFIPSRSIYLPSHKFFTGQPLIYNSGFAGTSLYVNNVGSAVSFKLEDNQIVYAVNLGKDYIGLSTLGFTSSIGIGTNLSSLEFWDQTFSYGVIGAAHSLTTLNPKVVGTVEKILGIVTTKSNHNLNVGDIINFDLTTSSNEVVKVVFDPVNRKILMKEISFSNTDVSLTDSSIDVSSYLGNIETGDKVVYIATSPIGGLTNYGVYYVLKTDFNSIKLCQYRSDINDSNFINFSSVGGSTQKIYLINPQIACIRTTKVEFDLSDSSLTNLDLQFYFDSTFVEKINERTGIFVDRQGIPGNSGAKVVLDLSSQFFPIYYGLFAKGSSDESKKQISSDVDVSSYNKISIINHQLRDKFEIVNISDKTFTFFNNKKLSYFEKQILGQNTTQFSYKTTSLSALGPISRLKINFPGRGYKKLPKIRGIVSDYGTNAVVKIVSPNIGQVETFTRVKDGFDYPTDPTLSPALSVPTVIGVKDIRTIDYIGIITGGKRYNSPPKLIVKNNDNGIELSAKISGGSVTSVDVIKNSTSLSAPLEIVSIYNSNGYEIDSISVVGDLVTLELSNNASLSPFISSGFGQTDYIYPFKIGDKIFIENCRLTDSTASLANYNSSSYDYSFFDVVGVSTSNNTVTYDMSGISTGSFGAYTDEFNLGVVINKNDVPEFSMILKDDVNYISNEKISSSTFSGRVMENGWDNNLNQMRLKDISGEINIGDKIFGEVSKVNGTVEYFDIFNLYATLGVSRDKTSSIDLSSGITNDYSQRISDNFYYQKFSYSIKGNIPYNVWRESVRSIVHPSGFKEFSDLEIFTKPTLNEVNLGIVKSSDMKPKILGTDSFTFVNIDQIMPFNTRKNFARVYEEELLPDGSIQNVFLDEGIDLTSFIVNKTNKVIKIDDISEQFEGNSIQSLDGRFADASDLLDGNREFIQEEVVGFITATYPGITTNPDWDRTICKRDVGYIVDAITHDLKYKSNNKSVEAGLAYWTGIGGTSYVAGESIETIAGFNYIIDLSKYIINNVGVKTSYQLGNTLSISTAVYNNITGITTITTSTAHGLSTTTTNYVVLKNIVFSCNSGGGINTAIFPNLGAGPDGNGPLSPKGFVYEVQVIDAVRFKVNPGPSTITHNYVNGGTVQKAFISTSQYINRAILADVDCSPTYSENCCADVWTAIGNYVGIITTIIGIGTTAGPNTITYPSLAKGGSVVGLTTFKLKNKGTSLFKHEFSGTNIDIINDKFVIPNHNFQSGQELIYSYSGGTPVGIATTSYVIGDVTTLLNVYNFDGSAILENGYNVGIATSGISGTVPNGTPYDLVLYPGCIGFNTTGLGTDATFNVLISYGLGGIPVGTSIVLMYGGGGYNIGEQVSISGTYFGGTSPTNDLSFVVSKTGPTVIQTEANQSYLSVPSTDLTGATFDVTRDNSGDIDYVKVLNGGSGYNSNSIISIAGTYVGGISPRDDFSFMPLELGTKILPTSVFVYKLNDNEFKLSGLSTSVFVNLTGVGTATHYLEYKEPNASAVITIDGIIQKALTRKSLTVSLASSVSSASTTILEISTGISSLAVRDIINLNNEYVSIRNIGINSENQIEVVRGYFGTVSTSHTVGTSGTILVGDFNIIGDVIYFDQAPYGKVGPVGLETGSIFAGRAFSRKFDPSVPQDKNILFDDISLSFTGIAATEFTLKSKGQTTDTIFNMVNSSGSEISNNPILLINNVFQDPTSDYTVDGSGTNVLRFLTGTPSSGKISKVAISTSYGYAPRIGAAATAVVSVAGTISNIVLTGGGSGYRSAPVVSIASTTGFGASITATVSAAGTITGFVIVNAGSGYTTTSLPEVVIGIPTGYSNLSLGYTGGSSGVGQRAKLTVEVGMGSSIISYKFDQPGVGYKVGDKLTPLGIKTNTTFRYDSLSISDVKYNNLTGITTVTTTSSHNLNENDNVILTGIAFTCGYDEVGIKTFSYDNATGICTVTTYSPHGLLRTDVDPNKTSDEAFLFNLPFSCPGGSGITTTIFPDGTSTYGRVFPVLSSVGVNTFTMNAGISTIVHTFEGWPEIGISTFSYDNITGVCTAITSVGHEFAVNDKITLAGLAFTCASAHIGVTTTIFPDGTSPYGYTFTVTGVTTNSFTFNAGISTIVHNYVGGGITKKVPTMQRVLRYTDDSTDGAYDFRVVSIASTNTFSVLAGSISTIPHYYTQGGLVTFRQFEPFVLTVEEVEKDSFSGFYPGQFIKFNDVSEFFNGLRRKFTLSTTVNGIRQVIGLKVPQGTDLDITNNIFIYINDILQVPGVSYRFSGSRVIFTEAPKAGSKCIILYYRGSSTDVELVDPPKTIKVGDNITIEENSRDLFDISQFDRVVKKVVTSDQLETFNYYSIGINTDPTKIRPLTWKKQLQDTVINGTLYPKSRPNLQSNIRPFATVIKKIDPTDTSIYVDNAYPLFTDVDQLTEDLRDVLILENRNIQECLVQANVSTSSTVTSISIINGGIGYANTQSPKVVISESRITKKDPIFNWTGGVGLTTSYSLNSIKYTNKFVAVGNNSVYSTSYDGINWQVSSVGFGLTSNFNSIESVGVGTTSFLVSVGNLGQIIKATDYGNVISSWSQIPLLEDFVIPGLGAVSKVSSGYTGTFNQVTYSNVTDTWVTVGAAGSIFVGTGVGTDSFVNRFSQTLSDLNSVTFGAEYFVAVGNDGVIRNSNDGNIWEFASSPVSTNLNKVIYANGKYIIVGDYGVVIQSTNRTSYQLVSNNLGIESIVNIYYNYGFYVITTAIGDLYYSFDLSNWIYRSTSQANFINDLMFVDNVSSDGRYVAIGSGATAIYAEPIYNRATAISSVTSGVVTSIQVINPGFGYDSSNLPPVIVEPDTYSTEIVRSFKVTGDHGIIIGITTYITGTPGIGTTTPKISFTLKSEQYDNSTLGVGYSSLNIYGVTNSQLSKGDYFVITDSNVEIGGDLVGITTLLGGMGNYPNSKIGIAKSFIDGIYRVEDVTPPSLGIVTVTCNFAPMEDNYVKVYKRGSNNSGIGTNDYYGRYSWAKIYDYQNRVLGNPETFEVFNDNGISGISSSPKIIRTRSVISK